MNSVLKEQQKICSSVCCFNMINRLPGRIGLLSRYRQLKHVCNQYTIWLKLLISIFLFLVLPPFKWSISPFCYVLVSFDGSVPYLRGLYWRYSVPVSFYLQCLYFLINVFCTRLSHSKIEVFIVDFSPILFLELTFLNYNGNSLM